MNQANKDERPCIDCGEPTRNPQRCRDCDIEYCLDSMQCSECKKLRTARDEMLGPVADAIWGENHRCECPDPIPATVYERKKADGSSQ